MFRKDLGKISRRSFCDFEFLPMIKFGKKQKCSESLLTARFILQWNTFAKRKKLTARNKILMWFFFFWFVSCAKISLSEFNGVCNYRMWVSRMYWWERFWNCICSSVEFVLFFSSLVYQPQSFNFSALKCRVSFRLLESTFNNHFILLAKTWNVCKNF